jgi:eukaryotic-like serine/threonine-protein kinase
MGTVFLARKRGAGGFEREVALKLTHSFLREDPEWATQLIDEAKLAGLVRHPNVVQVLDVEDDPNGVFLVMEYVEGTTLTGLLRQARRTQAPMPPAVVLRILVDALAGLHAAHELRDPEGRPLGLVHRDFTPQNILVGMDGASRLTDFGVAKASSRMSGTRTGVVKGKASYMSPEQVRGQPLDRRADVWAAGVVAWEAFAGRRMRDAIEDQAAMLMQVANEEAPRLSTVLPGILAAVDQAIASALTLERTRRCPSANRFSDALVRAWSPAVEPASAAEVAQYVAQLEGPSVSARRERAREAAQRRIDAPSVGSSSSAVASRSARARWIGAGAFAVAVLAGGAVVLRIEASRRALPVAPEAPSARATWTSSPRALQIVASEPITEVRVDDSLIVLSTPADRFSVEAPGPLRAGVLVMGTTSDGRQAVGIVGDGPGAVSLVFRPATSAAPVSVDDLPPVPTTASSRPKGRSARPSRPAPSSSAPSPDVPLAQSPYEP